MPSLLSQDLAGRYARRTMLFMLILLASNGCAIRAGRMVLAPDRFDYSNAIARSWKEQMLLNIVKMRYSEPPIFLDVAQVVVSYSFEARASVNALTWSGEASGAAADASGRWAESPTFTFHPLTGEKFIKSMMQPVSPVSLLSLVQAGWPIDSVFAVGVRSINGVQAHSVTALLASAGDPEFSRLLVLLRELQVSGTVALRVEQKGTEQAATLFFPSRPMDAAMLAKSKEARSILRLDPDARDFRIAFGAEPKDRREIAFLTRSMLEILAEASVGVEIPAEDLSEGRATNPPKLLQGPENARQFAVHVKSSAEKPPASDAFAMIHFRKRWFWLSDRDIPSKRSLGFLMVLFTLAETGTSAVPPVLTITRP